MSTKLTFCTLSLLFHRLEVFRQAHNALQTEPSDKITGMRVHAARLVIRKALKRTKRLQNQPSPLACDPQALPNFYTNRREMARLLHCGPRSIYNYLLLLERAGFLQKTFHGDKANFEITLNPHFLYRRGFRRAQALALDSGGGAPSGTWNRQTFALPTAAERATALTPSTPSTACPPAFDPAQAEAAWAQAVSLMRPQFPELLPTTRELGRELTRAFWRQAHQELWPGEYISPGYELRLLRLVWSDVMGGFGDCDDDRQMIALYRVRQGQLSAAVAYARRQGWTGFLPPPLYFSRARFEQERQQGTKGSFWWTFEWFKRSQESRAWYRRQALVGRAIDSIARRRPPAELKGVEMGPVELYGYWEQYLTHQGDAELNRDFQQAVAQLRLFGQLSMAEGPAGVFAG